MEQIPFLGTLVAYLTVINIFQSRPLLPCLQSYLHHYPRLKVKKIMLKKQTQKGRGSKTPLEPERIYHHPPSFIVCAILVCFGSTVSPAVQLTKPQEDSNPSKPFPILPTTQTLPRWRVLCPAYLPFSAQLQQGTGAEKLSAKPWHRSRACLVELKGTLPPPARAVGPSTPQHTLLRERIWKLSCHSKEGLIHLEQHHQDRACQLRSVTFLALL